MQNLSRPLKRKKHVKGFPKNMDFEKAVSSNCLKGVNS